MATTTDGRVGQLATDCGVCRRSVLVGERLVPWRDPRNDRVQLVCDLCRGRAMSRGWEPAGEARAARGGTRLRIEPSATVAASDVAGPEHEELAPQLAILQRVSGTDGERIAAPPALLERLRHQELELQRLRRELDPVRRAEEHRVMQRQAAELQALRAALCDRDVRIQQLQRARHAESSPLRMTGFALDAFNQSRELERMARIARTLGDPDVNVHDEGPGVPRRVRLTLSWDIAWYEFVVKLDLGNGRASVHETGTGGDPTVLERERRRPNARWRESGIVLA